MEQSNNKNPKQKQPEKETKRTVAAADILNSLKAELFDPEPAEKYQRAQDVAQQMFAVYTELQRAGFTKQEAYGIVIAMVGGK